MNVQRVPINWKAELPIFASETFLKTVSDDYGWLGGLADDGRLRCVLPYTLIRKAFLRMVRFRTQTLLLDPGVSVEEERGFLNGAIQHFRSAGADVIIPASNNAIFRTFPDGALAAPYGTYVLDLGETEETLWNNLHAKHRNVIRNAIKKGVEIRSGHEFLTAAHELMRATLKRTGQGFMGLPALQRLVHALGDNVKIFAAFHGGTIQGCAVIPFCAHCAHYLYGGSAANPLTGATNLLQWEAIRQFRSLGVRHYDFVGVRINPEKDSKQEGLKMFKERFGGQLVRGFMWKRALRPLKAAVYSLAVRLLRGGDVVDLEKHKLNV